MDKKQLEMCWIVNDDPIKLDLPDGYTMENYAGVEDKRAWCECCRDGMLIDENAGTQAFDDSMSDDIVVDLYKDVFFLKYKGEAIGTVTAFVREDGFRNPAELLSWLEANRPEEEPVLSHGDLCLPIVFFKDGEISCLIDLGNAGIADKWQDLALCYRSLKHNANGSYGKIYPGIHEDDLFKLLGIEPDQEKLLYYILLDELF